MFAPRVLSALVILVALVFGQSGSARVDHGRVPTRVMLIGDSVTQGSAGDWTWRYRLWKHLAKDGADVDFVGPRDDLWDVANGVPGNHDYADRHFDRDHAARWGMAMTQLDTPIGDLVRDFRPDVVVELLGVDDFAWLNATQTRLDHTLRTFVADARAENPDVDVVLSQLPQRWINHVADYDDQLSAFARTLDSKRSRVVSAQMTTNFQQGRDTYDFAHPSSHGEVKIAAGVADALEALGIGERYPRPLRFPLLGLRTPAKLKVIAQDRKATLSWIAPPGADGEYVWTRDVTAGQGWQRLPIPLRGVSWASRGLVNHHSYAYRLQATKGTIAAQHLYSNVVEVTPRASPPR